MTAGAFLVTDAWFAGRDTLPAHHHDRTVVGVTLSGEWDSVIGRHTLLNEAGVVHTEPAGETHSNQFGARGTHVLIVQPDPGASELLEPCQALLNEVQRLAPLGARAIATRVISELTSADDLSPMAIEAGCLELLVSASRLSRPPERRRPAWLMRVADYLRAEYRTPPSLHQLAAIAGVHPSHLLREFKRAFGETPAALVRRLRAESSASLLRSSDEPLSGIAAAAGFADQSHFTRQFRRYFGMTPSAYRRAQRHP